MPVEPRPSDRADMCTATSEMSKSPLKSTVATNALVPDVPDGIPLPCVLPQTTKSFRGACFSPFVRAYVPQLTANGIDQETFVAFIDGLNEAFVAHPVFEAVNIMSSVISMAVPVPDVQYAFGGLALGAVAAGRLTSYSRTKAYVRAVNAKIFHVRGLHVSIMTTKKMMEVVGCGEEALHLPALNTFADIDEERLAEPLEENSDINEIYVDDPRMRRIKALEGRVMPLDFDVPQAVYPDNLFKRIGDAHVQWLSRRQQQSLLKKRGKATDKYHEEHDKAEEKRLKGEQEVAKLERKLTREQNKFESKMNADKISSESKERDKLLLDYQKQAEKIETQIVKERNKVEEAMGQHQQNAAKQLRKGDEREEKIARKIRWVVIQAWDEKSDEHNDLEHWSSNGDDL